MLPIVWSHVSFTCVTIVIWLISVQFALTNKLTAPLFEETISLTFTQGFFMPYFFFKQFKKDSRHNRRVMATNATTGEARIAVHSAVIQNGW
ncbi:hypothetical protein PENTCL1PPCAC_13803, partial [Pristionchus entomophagus]